MKYFGVSLVTVVASVFFVFILYGSLASGYQIENSVSYSTPISAPERLLIPVIGVDAKVQEVGLTKTNAMANPSNFTDVGWYKYGTIPGKKGSAVIGGHVDNAIALPGVFKHLENVKVDDEITIIDKTGNQIHFVISKIDVYNYDEAPAEEIFHDDSSASILRLITCGGMWLPDKKTYDKRIVVTATLR